MLHVQNMPGSHVHKLTGVSKQYDWSTGTSGNSSLVIRGSAPTHLENEKFHNFEVISTELRECITKLTDLKSSADH